MVVNILDWVGSIYHVARREHLVEVRVLFEGQSFLFVLGTAEVPKNFFDWQIRVSSENLWYRGQIP
jgi:hypothetical protein